MMEEEKLRMKEEEGDQESDYDPVPDNDDVSDDDGGENVVEQLDEKPATSKELDVPNINNSASNFSALSYELFVEQNKVADNDNNDENDNGDQVFDEPEETRELVTSPGDSSLHRKVIDYFSQSAQPDFSKGDLDDIFTKAKCYVTFGNYWE